MGTSLYKPYCSAVHILNQPYICIGPVVQPETQIKMWSKFENFLSSRTKEKVEHFKCLFQIQDDGGIVEKSTCTKLITINKELPKYKITIFCVWF